MKRYSLYNIFLGVFLAAILITGLLIGFIFSKHRQDLVSFSINEKLKMAEMVKETVASPSWLYRSYALGGLDKELLNRLAGFEDVNFIRVVKADGQIYQSTLEDELGAIIQDPAIGEAIQSQKPLVKQGLSGDKNIKVLFYPGHENQIILVGFSLARTEFLVREALGRYLLVVFAILTFLGIAIIFILRGIIIPLEEITYGCQEVKKGKLDTKLKVTSKTEIGELAAAFSEMIKDLKDSREESEENRQVLEIKVKARTQELQELTGNLERQVKARTKELEEKLKELETFNRLAVDRELKMAELKKELEKLKTKATNHD